MSDNLKQQTEEQEQANPADNEPMPDTVAAEGDGATEATEQVSDAWENERTELTEKLQATLDEHDRLASMYRRLRADFDNFRRRKNVEVEILKSTAASGMVTDLLPVIDNLERAVESASESEGPLAQGVRLVLRQLGEVLENHGVEVIASVGELFDPQCHEAVGQVAAEGDVQPGTIVDEVLKGYRMGERVLRPSMVRVVG